MQIRESYLYVGMDLHKKTHTAVLVNCWNETDAKIEKMLETFGYKLITLPGRVLFK